MPFPPAFLDELAARNPIEEVVGQYVNLKRSRHQSVWPLPLPWGEDARPFP